MFNKVASFFAILLLDFPLLIPGATWKHVVKHEVFYFVLLHLFIYLFIIHLSFLYAFCSNPGARFFCLQLNCLALTKLTSCMWDQGKQQNTPARKPSKTFFTYTSLCIQTYRWDEFKVARLRTCLSGFLNWNLRQKPVLLVGIQRKRHSALWLEYNFFQHLPLTWALTGPEHPQKPTWTGPAPTLQDSW